MQKITGKEKGYRDWSPVHLSCFLSCRIRDFILNLHRLLQREGDVKGADVALNHISGVEG